jgi:hypothetical protein
MNPCATCPRIHQFTLEEWTMDQERPVMFTLRMFSYCIQVLHIFSQSGTLFHRHDPTFGGILIRISGHPRQIQSSSESHTGRSSLSSMLRCLYTFYMPAWHGSLFQSCYHCDKGCTLEMEYKVDIGNAQSSSMRVSSFP